MKNLARWGGAVVSCCVAMSASAVDISLSGFATAGYAQSNQHYNYQRFVNQHGTLKRDSVLGAQVDVRLNETFGITVQGKLAPSMKSDDELEATTTWAFLSWRPSNDWLIRVGRLRVPMYLHSESMDVGATFDFARLPAEVYASVQTTDGDGIFVGKTWSIDDSELTLVGYAGSAKMSYRYYRRDDMPPLQSSGSFFVPVKTSARGLVLTLQREEDTYRVSAHDTSTDVTDSQTMPVTFPYVGIMPGVGYYQTTNLLPGPGVPDVDRTRTMVYTVAADVGLGNGFRAKGEYVRRDVRNTLTGPDAQGAYLAVLKPIGEWTPYLSVARLVSMDPTRDLYNRVNSNRLPGFIPGSALINASQRAGADGINAYDQTTWALGTSYRINPTSKLKAEWARTRTGDMSLFVDAPPGQESGKRTINVFSFSYNVVF